MSRRPQTDLERYQRGGGSEDDLLSSVTQWASLRGWVWHHVRRSDLALQQGAEGFPDLVLARDRRVIFAELKSEVGQLTRGQMAWLLAIVGQSNEPAEATARLWRPADLDRIIEELT